MAKIDDSIVIPKNKNIYRLKIPPINQMSELTAFPDPDVDAIRSNIDNTFISDV
jgi:hypothetical protein